MASVATVLLGLRTLSSDVLTNTSKYFIMVNIVNLCTYSLLYYFGSHGSSIPQLINFA